MVIVPGEGPRHALIMFIGEAPGYHELREGRPFVGDAGTEFDQYLDHIGFDRRTAYVTNLIKVGLPRNRRPKASEVTDWLPALYQEIEEVQPSILVTLGASSTEVFLSGLGLERTHGIPHRVQVLGRDRVVFPTCHPAAALHSKGYRAPTTRDFEAFRAFLHDGHVWTRGAPTVVLPGDQFPRSKEPPPVVALDTEGSPHDPWGLTLSAELGIAYHFQTARNLPPLSRVVFHYAVHDLHVLQGMGLDPGGLAIDDTLIMAYELAMLGLEGVLQGDADDKGGLSGLSLKTLAYRHAGMVLRAFEDLPDDIRLTDHPDFIQYAGEDADATGRVFRILRDQIGKLGMEAAYQADLAVLPMIEMMERGGLPVNLERFTDLYGELLEREGYLLRQIHRTAGAYGLMQFNPASTKQVADLLFRRMGFRRTRRTKSGRAYSTSDEALGGLAEKPFVGQLLELRRVRKMRQAYLLPIFREVST